MPTVRATTRLLALAALAAGAAALAAELYRVAVGTNEHVVVPGRVYRTAQLTPAQFADVARRRGLRTVVNLRGGCPGFDWYAGECRATADLDLDHVDVAWSATRLPPPDELRRLVEALDRAAKPLVVHCRRGVDRTGLASAIAVLLTEGASVSAAARQLGVRYGHVPLNGTEQMDAFFELYTSWLSELHCDHSPGLFRHWAANVYCPGECKAEFEPLDWPASVPAGRATLLKVRARNASVRPWVMTPGRTSGTHARWVVLRADGGYLRHGETGTYDHTVPPGESVDLEVPVPPLPASPHAYVVVLDMIDRRQTAFAQQGSAPLMRGLRVE